MAEGHRLLILGGTTEAAALAARACEEPALEVVTSLAGRTRAPAPVSGAVRSGGFGGAGGLVEFLREGRVDLLVDATHPYAATMSRHAVLAAGAAGVPLLRVERPPWTRRPGDRWVEVGDAASAAVAVAAHGERAFLTVGRTGLGPFCGVRGVWFLVRLVEPPPAPLPLAAHAVVVGRGPFEVEAEQALLAHHRVDVVVSKNSGGEATYAKIAAARARRLPVVLIARPPPAGGAVVATVDDALAWVRARVAGGVRA